MNKFVKSFFLLCGVSLALAALPVFAQQEANGITINKKPLRDFSESVKNKFAKKEVDLDKSFLVEFESVLTKDGKFDSTKSKFIRSEGDAKMIEIAKQGIEAVGESGWFGHLQVLNVSKINIIFAQDENNVSAIIKSKLETEDRAKVTVSGFNTIIQIGRMQVKGEEEKVLLNSVNVTIEGKQFIINFAIPKSVAQEMVKRRLQESERKETMPNGR